MTEAELKEDNTTNRADILEKYDHQLYPRPHMPGQVRDEEEEDYKK